MASAAFTHALPLYFNTWFIAGDVIVTSFKAPIVEAPPEILIVFVEPVPEAVTPEPVKFKVVASVVRVDPSSWIVKELPPPLWATQS